MNEFYDIKPFAEILDQIGRNGSGETVRRMSRKLRGKAYSAVAEVLRRHEEMFVRFAAGLRKRGKLFEQDFTELRQLLESIQDKLQRITAVDVPTKKVDDEGRDFLRALHLLGGLEVASDYAYSALFVSPRMLTQAFSIASLLEAPSRAKHMQAVSSLRQTPMTSEEAAELEQRHVKHFADALREALQRNATLLIPNAWQASALANLSVELLPTATDFYEAGVDYYRSRAGRGRSHYIFATTSGILLPQDYYGSSYFEKILAVPELLRESDKNPKRVVYFDALARVRGRPRWYFFELERAGRAFQATVKELGNRAGAAASARYREDSKRTIARFLQIPQFGLVGVDRFPSEYDHLTLGNGRHMFLSGRDKTEDKPKIGHGLWLRPRLTGFRAFWKEFKKLPARDWLLGAASSVTISALKDDLRFGLLEALASGFAVPFILASRRYWSKVEAQETFLNIAEHVARSLGDVRLRFYWHPEHRPMGEAVALRNAEKVVSELESA